MSDHGLQTRGIRRQLTGEGMKGTGRLRSGDYTRGKRAWRGRQVTGSTFHIRKPESGFLGKVAGVAGAVTGAKEAE